MSGMPNLRLGKLRLIERLEIISRTYVPYFYTLNTWKICTNTIHRVIHYAEIEIRIFINYRNAHSTSFSPFEKQFGSNNYQSVMQKSRLPNEKVQLMKKKHSISNHPLGFTPEMFDFPIKLCVLFISFLKILHRDKWCAQLFRITHIAQLGFRNTKMSTTKL